MRGRVMALWGLAWMGSTPIGGPIVGWVGEVLGARWSLLIGGVPTLVVGLVSYPMLARLDRASSAAARPEDAPATGDAPAAAAGASLATEDASATGDAAADAPVATGS
jgi:MFS family permease